MTLTANAKWDFDHPLKKDPLSSIHPYPAKFIPDIPRELIAKFGVPVGTSVCDPFCGSGTTLLEAKRAGYSAIGIDLNPIACLITKAKIETSEVKLSIVAEDVVSRAKASIENIEIPDIPNLDHWFKEEVQVFTSSLVDSIKNVECDTTRSFLNTALSSILVRVSNQDSDTRYAAVENEVLGTDVFRLFLIAVSKIENAHNNEPLRTEGTRYDVLNKDIMAVSKEDFNRHKLGLSITSPPYPNAYEYWLYHKYRMYWLGLDPKAVKEKEIGARAHYFKKNPPTVLAFQNQMKHVLNVLQESTVSGGHVCFVIGRSKIHGEIINNSDLIENAGEELGLTLVENISRRIKSNRKSFNLSHANIKTENIIVFRVEK